MSTRMQQRRGTAEQWTLANPVLAGGEIGVETDTYKFKIGDGVNTWSSLDYFSASVDLSGYYTSSETDTAISTAVANVVDTAPGVLDTLNELAAAIGDDADFVTTINTSITDGDSATLTSANSYTDGEITALDTSLKTYADTVEADAKSYADLQDAAQTISITDAYEAYVSAQTADSATVTYVDDQDTATLLAANAYVDGVVLGNYDPIGSADTAETNAKAYTDTEIANLVDSSPATLDTLNELAAALGDDANFATTVTDSIATKAPLESPSFTGTVDFSNSTVQGIPQPIHPFVMLGA